MEPAAHVPVLLQRVVDLVAPVLQHEGAVLVDAPPGRLAGLLADA